MQQLLEVEDRGCFFPARVLSLDETSNRVKVHFLGWSEKHDQASLMCVYVRVCVYVCVCTPAAGAGLYMCLSLGRRRACVCVIAWTKDGVRVTCPGIALRRQCFLPPRGLLTSALCM